MVWRVGVMRALIDVLNLVTSTPIDVLNLVTSPPAQVWGFELDDEDMSRLNSLTTQDNIDAFQVDTFEIKHPIHAHEIDPPRTHTEAGRQADR